MTIQNLDALFCPRSIALIGASDHVGSLGTLLLRNLIDAGYQGNIFLVNPKYKTVMQRTCYSDIAALPESPDLAIICTPANTLPALIDSLLLRGTRAAIVISAVANHDSGEPQNHELQWIINARQKQLRIIGPNCIGVQSTGHHINASFAHLAANAGSLAFVTQSGAMVTTVLDWAQPRGIGFSHVVSLGDMKDVDCGDMLEYLAADPNTTAILLYVEAIPAARKFMIAARAVADKKPVIVIKAGRSESGARAAASHTGMMAGADAVYEVALHRAGVLRVFDMEELFAAAETLALSRTLQGERVAVITNGGGPAVLAVDALTSMGGTLASLSDDTIHKLNHILPGNWSKGNPIDIIGDATPQRFHDALTVLLSCTEIDAVIVLNCPTAVMSNLDAAAAVVSQLTATDKAVFTCWLGEATARKARQLLHAHKIPTYETPELAVQGFMHRVRYHRSQTKLQQTFITNDQTTSTMNPTIRKLIQHAQQEQREWLLSTEVDTLLQTYNIPAIDSHFVQSAEQARQAATELNTCCVVKIVSRNITHKSDMGGVVVNLESPSAVFDAVTAMKARIQTLMPQAIIDGFVVQPMISRPGTRELIVGFHLDPQFGPVMLFGQGGTDVELIKDFALELPPLNIALAHEMIKRTRVHLLLQAHRGQPAANMDEIAAVLIHLAQLAMDCPDIVEMEINPLLVDAHGVLTIDARVRIALRPS